MIQTLPERLRNLDQKELEDLLYSLGDYEEQPPTINEFIDSNEYLGNYFGGGFWPYWRPVLNDIYPSPHYSPYTIIALRGAIGRGKSVAACTGIAYDICCLLCLRNPQAYFSLLPATKITIAIFNVTLGLATNVIWDMIEQMIASSPWFQKRVDIALATKKKKLDDTIFPKRIDIFIGSRVGHSLGRAVFGAILSEANFDVLNDQTLKSFNSLIARGQSRFLGVNSPFKVWVDSSEGSKSSSVNQIVDSYKGSDTLYMNQGPTWEPKMHIRDKYSGKMFKIYKGTESVAPRVLTTPTNDEELDILFSKDPQNIMEVPVEHFDRFDADINAALRDLAGISTASKYRLIKHTDRLQRCIGVAPLFPDVISLDFDDDNDQINDYMMNKEYFSSPYHPNSFRYIHIDIALNGDKLGIASSFITGFREKKLVDAITLEETTEVFPEFFTEFAFAIECKPGQQIPLFKVRLFIKWVWERGITIECVSCDGFESADMLQMLLKMGIRTELVSVDRTAVPYLFLRGCINDERIKLPLNLLLLKELTELEMSSDGKKVDHPDSGQSGSKDTADAVCASIFQANANSVKHMFTQMLTDDSDDTVMKTRDMFWGSQG